MRDLSDAARGLLDELQQHHIVSRGHLPSWVQDQALDGILWKLGMTAEPAVVPRIASYLLWTSTTTASAAARAIERLMAEARPDDLPWLDEAIRQAWDWSDMAGPTQTADFVDDVVSKSGSQGGSILGVLSFHPSGYVREEAVRRLARTHDGSELPYLLLRLNDWVDQVRDEARRAVFARLRDDQATNWARHFSLVDRIARTRRADPAPLIQTLAHILTTTHGQAAMLDAMKNSSRHTARAIVRFLIEHAPSGLGPVVAAGAIADDALIRTAMVRVVAQAFPPAEALPTLQRMASDASPIVRRESLLALARAFPDAASELAERAVLDPSASVRETARFLLKDSHADFAATYRSALSTAPTPRRLAGILIGLAEVGAASDAERAAPYLSHPSPSVRRAAVQSVMRLAGEAYADRIVNMLLDPSSAVSSAARNTLRKHARGLSATQLTAILAAALPHARLNAVHLMAALPKWDSISCLIDTAASGDQDVASLARKQIGVWNAQYNRSQMAPTTRQLERLIAALSSSGKALDERTTEEIRFVLRTL